MRFQSLCVSNSEADRQKGYKQHANELVIDGTL